MRAGDVFSFLAASFVKVCPLRDNCRSKENGLQICSAPARLPGWSVGRSVGRGRSIRKEERGGVTR